MVPFEFTVAVPLVGLLVMVTLEAFRVPCPAESLASTLTETVPLAATAAVSLTAVGFTGAGGGGGLGASPVPLKFSICGVRLNALPLWINPLLPIPPWKWAS